MDEIIKKNQNCEELEDMENEENATNDGSSIKLYSLPQKNVKARSHSRSRSPVNTKHAKRWVSSNAFVNFVQDFRQNHIGMGSTKLFQLAGEKWRRLLPNEKQPYIDAAKSIKNQKDQLKKENINTCNPTNTEPKKNEKHKQTKSIKNSKNNKERKQKKKKKYNTESDTDSAVSATSAASLTSEDLSDMSS